MRRSTGFLFSSCVLLVGLFSLSARPVGAETVITSCTQANLQAALNAGGLITFNCGTNPVTIDLTSTLTVPVANTTVNGGGLITLWGNGSVRLVYNATTFTLRNLTLANGHAANYAGGAIWNLATGTLLLDNVVINDSAANPSIYGGGAVYNQGSLIAHNTTFSNNLSAGGGAIYNDVGAKATLDQNSRVIGNHATGQYGGGITNVGTMTLTDVLVDHNVLTSTLGSPNWSEGGGIMNYAAATLSLNNVILSNNVITGSNPTAGGAISNRGILTMKGGSVSYNLAFFGGGVFNGTTVPATLENVALSHNQAFGGGGLYTVGELLTLSGSTFSYNSAEDGGGLNNNGATISAHGNTYVGNSAERGGAVFTRLDFDSLNDTYSGNSATIRGGGIYTVQNDPAGSRSTLWNVTVSGNGAPVGGGIHSEPNTTVVFKNAIIADSTAGGNCSGGSINSNYSLSSDNTCVFVGTGNSVNPNVKLSPLGNYGGPTLVHMPLLGSPLIDGVSGSDAPNVDQRGKPRPVGGGYDIGSVERQANDRDWPWALFLPLLLR